MDKNEHPNDLHIEHNDLIEEIYVAFAGVTREDGISWSEADVLDNYGSMEERLAAQASDKDTTWQSLVDDATWNPDHTSHLSFLDAVGFRYYLAPAMVRGIRAGTSEIVFHLTLPKSSLRSYTLEKWSLLTPEQMRCVKRFIVFMDAAEEGCGADWMDAFYSYWDKVE
ncbi:MAG: hypothetical protein KF784_15885 [Fimbriimonadaceae bacterium]|nr:hypothetical protein [Fimbriimonadaceae bacterium]